MRRRQPTPPQPLPPYVQYEELTEEECQDGELRRVKDFIGLDSSVKQEPLPLRNSRRFSIRPEGWPMKRSQYQVLVEKVRADAQELMRMLEEHGKVKDAEKWMARWEEVWDDHLASCDIAGDCNSILS